MNRAISPSASATGTMPPTAARQPNRVAMTGRQSPAKSAPTCTPDCFNPTTKALFCGATRCAISRLVTGFDSACAMPPTATAATTPPKPGTTTISV